MALSSPGVEVREIDLTGVVPAAASTVGAYAGRFNWGPMEVPVLVSSEDELGRLFSTPKASFAADAVEANSLAVSFLTAASYLAYADALRVSRVANINDATPANNAVNSVSSLSSGAAVLVKNVDDFNAKVALGSLDNHFLIGKYAGSLGNSVGVSAVFTPDQYASPEITSTEDFTLNKDDNGNKTLSIPALGGVDFTDYFSVGDVVKFTYNSIEYKNTVKSVSALSVALVDIGANLPNFGGGLQFGIVTNVRKEWKYASAFNGAPADGTEFHLVVYDADGTITGAADTVLELFPYLSITEGATNADGTTAFYKTVINDTSAWVWVGEYDVSVQTGAVTFNTYTETLAGGSNGSTPSSDDYIDAYSVFLDKENVDIALVIAPPASDSIADSVVANYLIQNLAEVRKDVVVYLSPRFSDVVNKPNQERANVLAYRATLTSSSYGFMDSGWKYMYDKYNNTFRWVPLCGDVAGTAARTDDERAEWWSHAGYNRGIIKNVFRLAWNPNQSNRDDLYQKGINPVITQNGAGTILFGDKTLLDRPSAFDRINVRRLFIVLEKAISNASKYSLFEFNDEFTRARFVALVEPFLRDVKARRGVSDYKVVCDETNNTAQVINTNRFIGDVYIRPNYSINYITLNFIAVPNGVEFTEVVGAA